MTHAGQVVLVTGAARGIGHVISDMVARRGATVVRADCLPRDQWLPSTGDAEGLQLHLDVTDRSSCAATVRATVERLGSLSVLVNNAGVVTRGSALSVTEEELRRVTDVNLDGALRMAQEAHPHLAADGGAIVNVTSTAGVVAVPNTLGYALGKASLVHLTKVLALEWAPAGVRVNAVAPTIVPSEMTGDVLHDEEWMAAKLATIPMGRVAQPEDVAEAVAFLSSTAAGMVTGQVLAVDGGVTL